MKKVHIIKPFALDKNLGRAYNEAMALIPEGDWGCLMDCDTMFLTPDAGVILHEYVRLVDDNSIDCSRELATPLLTCYTNRIGCTDQLINGQFYNESDIMPHIRRAEMCKQWLYEVQPLRSVISGFMMVVSKAAWSEIKFSEDMKCLGVDNDYSARILASGRYVMRMNGLYVWHTYRIMKGIQDKTHLL